MMLDPDEMPKWLSIINSKNRSDQSIIAGINEDDCAVITIGNQEVVFTTDFLNSEPIALELGLGSFWDLGRILVAANISDLCGTGAKPQGFLSSIMIEKTDQSDENFKKLMEGVIFELSKYNIPLIGGDTKLGKSNSFCGCAIGYKETGTKLSLKNKAQVNDSIWVSGSLGGVAAAIMGLKEGIMNESWNSWAKDKIINPVLPLVKSRELSIACLANGGTDVSDGLGADLWDMCESSRVGAVVYVDSIPIDSQVKQYAAIANMPSWIYSLTIGGDFQFIFTSERNNDPILMEMGFFKIGEITEMLKAYILVDGTLHPMPKIGHRDINKKSFSVEVRNLLSKIQDDINQ